MADAQGIAVEVLNDFRSVAAQAERVVMEVMEMLRTGQFQEEVGSAPYVRRLRDQAVMRILAGPLVDRHMEEARSVAENNPGDFGKTVNAMMALWAAELADAGLCELGYDPPDEGSD